MHENLKNTPPFCVILLTVVSFEHQNSCMRNYLHIVCNLLLCRLCRATVDSASLNCYLPPPNLLLVTFLLSHVHIVRDLGITLFGICTVRYFPKCLCVDVALLVLGFPVIVTAPHCCNCTPIVVTAPLLS